MLFIDKIPHSIDVIGFWGICIIGLTSAWMKAIGWKNIRTNLCSIHAWPKSKDISVWQILTNPRSIRLTLSLIWVEKFFNSILYQHLHNSKNVACHEIKVLMSFNYYSLIPFHRTLSINHLCLETFLIVRWQWTKKLTQKLTKNILIESSFSDLHIESHDVRSSTIILMEKTLILDKKQMDRRMKDIFKKEIVAFATWEISSRQRIHQSTVYCLTNASVLLSAGSSDREITPLIFCRGIFWIGAWIDRGRGCSCRTLARARLSKVRFFDIQR